MFILFKLVSTVEEHTIWEMKMTLHRRKRLMWKQKVFRGYFCLQKDIIFQDKPFPKIKTKWSKLQFSQAQTSFSLAPSITMPCVAIVGMNQSVLKRRKKKENTPQTFSFWIFKATTTFLNNRFKQLSCFSEKEQTLLKLLCTALKIASLYMEAWHVFRR